MKLDSEPFLCAGLVCALTLIGCGSGGSSGGGTPTGPATQVAQPVFNRIFFASQRDGGLGDIYSMNFDGSDVKRITNSPDRKTCPSVSPDGVRVAYFNAVAGTLVVQLVIVNADGSGQPQSVQLKGGTTGYCPKWSSDGQSVLVVDQVGNGATATANVSRFSKNLETLTTFPLPGFGVMAPAYTPTGDRLVFGRTNTDSNVQNGDQIVSSKLDGTDQVVIDAGYTPSWSASRNEIAFACRPVRGLCIKSMATQSVRRINSEFVFSMIYSPDGNTVAFERFDDGPGSDVCLMSATGTTPTCTMIGQVGGQLSWSPDSQTLAFRCGSAIILDICTIKADGTGSKKIVSHPADDLDPAFSPMR